jgi:hypothetical protein
MTSEPRRRRAEAGPTRGLLDPKWGSRWGFAIWEDEGQLRGLPQLASITATFLERDTGFEPATFRLGTLLSTLPLPTPPAHSSHLCVSGRPKTSRVVALEVGFEVGSFRARITGTRRYCSRLMISAESLALTCLDLARRPTPPCCAFRLPGPWRAPERSCTDRSATSMRAGTCCGSPIGRVTASILGAGSRGWGRATDATDARHATACFMPGIPGPVAQWTPARGHGLPLQSRSGPPDGSRGAPMNGP